MKSSSSPCWVNMYYTATCDKATSFLLMLFNMHLETCAAGVWGHLKMEVDFFCCCLAKLLEQRSR